jgi:phospholipid/cholesterol/gamma-HCH transport system substrate-binding protein
MRTNHTLEVGTGIFVLLGIAALLFLTTQLPSSGLKLAPAKAGYHVTAAFDNVGDLKTGSPVTMAGVRIGDVTAIRIDPRQFKAVVTMRIDPQYNQIPDDSDASIQTEGLLGGKYVGLGPGGSETFLKNGSTIEFTQSALVLENLVNKLFANIAGGKSESGGGSGNGAQSGGTATGGADSDSNQGAGKPKSKPPGKESSK